MLTRQTGQVLRFAGLLTEMACLAGLVSGRGGGLGAKVPAPFLTSGLALGFVLWAVGTFATLRSPRPKPPAEGGEGRGWL